MKKAITRTLVATHKLVVRGAGDIEVSKKLYSPSHDKMRVTQRCAMNTAHKGSGVGVSSESVDPLS